MTTETKEVYEAINAVQEDMSKEGISKDKNNSGFGASYKYRGIDDVYKALAPLLAKHNLIIIPRTIGRECVERKSAKGNALFYVSLDVEFDFVCSTDGSMHTARTFGEAMDSSDKATNKALAAAYKYLCFLIFCIPVEGTPDADAESHEVEEEVVSFMELLSKISDSKAVPHLTNIYKKYEEVIKGLTEKEEKTIMGAFKVRKEELIDAI